MSPQISSAFVLVFFAERENDFDDHFFLWMFETIPINIDEIIGEVDAFESLEQVPNLAAASPSTSTTTEPTQNNVTTLTATEAASLTVSLSVLRTYFDSTDFTRLEHELHGRGMDEFDREVRMLQPPAPVA
ncbi:hypothetical protein BC938DRAFT_482413 [Jimgerdemannia flammicorona]|uniref:Uncharacterized protein n=1 Tax=Jimgerdemannia flammicorona TaxID=994334 RepID=A0A433QE06_9FUNG|nr:hypothetical protein BC938DRAFT_482413 [Jimgerdemannia flammicorona]